MIRFNKIYFYLTILIFVTEILIALYVHDDLIRPYGGDVLVVILIYCCIRSFLNIPVWIAATFVLLFAFGIEWLQRLNFVARIGLEHSKLANVVLGNSFAWNDIFSYCLGIAIVLVVERMVAKTKNV